MSTTSVTEPAGSVGSSTDVDVSPFRPTNVDYEIFKKRRPPDIGNSGSPSRGVEPIPRDGRTIAEASKVAYPERITVSYIPLQEWDGVITEIHGDRIVAMIADAKAAPGEFSDVADFDRRDISEEDTDKVVVGALFRWFVGYQVHGAQRRRFSQIIFRDFPRLSARAVIQAQKIAEHRHRLLPEMK